MAIAAHNAAIALRVLRASPLLATSRFAKGATRRETKAYYLDDIGYYVYPGATALHIAAAAYQSMIVKKLLAMGADVGAKNRRGAEPLHAVALGTPGSSAWNPRAQAATIALLVNAGADPNAVDKGGATPLHRAVRARCAASVKALLSTAPTLDGKTTTARRRYCSLLTTRGAAAAVRPQQKRSNN